MVLMPSIFAGTDMGAGVSDEIGHAQNFAALQLIDERLDGAQAQRRIRRAQVEQIGIVRDDSGDAGFLPIGVKIARSLLCCKVWTPTGATTW